MKHAALFAIALLTYSPALADTFGYGGSNPYQNSTSIDAGRERSHDYSQPEREPEPEENPYGGRYVDDDDDNDSGWRTYRDPSGADIRTDGSGVNVPND